MPRQTFIHVVKYDREPCSFRAKILILLIHCHVEWNICANRTEKWSSITLNSRTFHLQQIHFNSGLEYENSWKRCDSASLSLSPSAFSNEPKRKWLARVERTVLVWWVYIEMSMNVKCTHMIVFTWNNASLEMLFNHCTALREDKVYYNASTHRVHCMDEGFKLNSKIRLMASPNVGIYFHWKTFHHRIAH